MMAGLDLYEEDGHHMLPVDMWIEIQCVLKNTTGKKHLTVEMIRITILLKPVRERDEAQLALAFRLP
ncbi:hypothetical protein TNCV_213141 [Trichonephila clavipes]|nr:hypothetical protein TNCV_213141 [Trichonephila clavipes]